MRQLCLALLISLSLAAPSHAQNYETTQFINGQWFDGHGFKRMTFYAINGTLTRHKPASIVQTVDLASAFVIPPFGDAAALPGPLQRYATDGVLYAMLLAPQTSAPASPGVELALSRGPAQGPANAAIISTRPNDAELAQLPAVAARAYAEKSRLAAEVSNLPAYRAAVTANVDIIAGLPADALTKDDARDTARRRILVVPSAMVSQPPAQSLRALKSARVELGIGSGGPASSAKLEALHLRSTGLFSNRELLKMWTEITPRAIFPTRKIGYLREGYEASFLVLSRDPLKDFSAIESSTMRYKQGRRIAEL